MRKLAAIMFTDIVGYTALMMHHEAVASRFREVREAPPLPPIKEPGPEVGVANHKTDEPPIK